MVSAALGVAIPRPAAVGAYYRSQFLNSVLPGGVLGDVHRAVGHGRRAGDLGRGLRAVAWERFSGQVVQAVLTGMVLLTLPSPVRPVLPEIAGGVAGVIGLVVVTVWMASRRGRPKLASTVIDDLRRLRGVSPQVVLASALVVVGHTATFVIAARVAGCTASLGTLIALAMLVQTAVVIPLSIGGWGLREGAAAWAFAAAGFGAPLGVTVTTIYGVLGLAAAGFGAPLGVTVTTIYGVLGLAAVAPGAGLLLVDAARRIHGAGAPGGSRRRNPVRPASSAWEAAGG